MDTIDSKHVGTVDGFDIAARIVDDPDASPGDFDRGGYTPDQIAAYRRDEWSFVGTIVTASKAGVELGSAALWGSEYGSAADGGGWISPLDGEGQSFVNGYGPQLIAEAVAEAKKKLQDLVDTP